MEAYRNRRQLKGGVSSHALALRADVGSGSWPCENALAEALIGSDIGEVSARDPVFEFAAGSASDVD
jgi:hypothetical protein